MTVNEAAGRSLDIGRQWAGRLVVGYGHLLLAVIGAILFVVFRPPVADLQAAEARAAAAAHGVGLGYWLSW